jgi:hypothetical protein
MIIQSQIFLDTSKVSIVPDKPTINGKRLF